MDPQYKAAGEFIRRRREKLKLTQPDLVDMLNKMGVRKSISESSLSRLELGQGGQTFWGDAQFVNALASALRVSMEEIMSLMGYIDTQDDLRVKRLANLLATFDDKTLDTAEQILEVLAGKNHDTDSR